MGLEFGKWLMDVAKYILTALLLATFLGGYEFRSYYYSLYSFDVRNAWHRIVAG